MAADDEAARKARAQRLRKQIQRLAAPEGEAGSAQEAPPPAPESPRDFIHRKMRGLDKKEPES
jgi:hypothetical protein